MRNPKVAGIVLKEASKKGLYVLDKFPFYIKFWLDSRNRYIEASVFFDKPPTVPKDEEVPFTLFWAGSIAESHAHLRYYREGGYRDWTIAKTLPQARNDVERRVEAFLQEAREGMAFWFGRSGS